MADSTIPIAEATLARLQELARWPGSSLGEALDQAIKDQYHRKIWQAANAGYAALHADPEAWAEFEAEGKLWDNALMDVLDPSERWSEDGDVLPPTTQEPPS
jgi:hypothetical protein